MPFLPRFRSPRIVLPAAIAVTEGSFKVGVLREDARRRLQFAKQLRSSFNPVLKGRSFSLRRSKPLFLDIPNRLYRLLKKSGLHAFEGAYL